MKVGYAHRNIIIIGDNFQDEKVTEQGKVRSDSKAGLIKINKDRDMKNGSRVKMS
uniref:Uncharacterized protein n=1 Tax=Arundo donax TaxID=35708 RepID=A0A0A9B6Q9_ARUDO